MYEILTDKSINWDAISAISNILVVFATFVTILVTVWLTFRNSTPRGRVMNTSSSSKENLHFVNTGVIDITLLVGVIATNKITKKGHPKRDFILEKVIQKTLKPTENYHWAIKKYELSRKLLELKDDLQVGDQVKLYIIYIDSFRRRHISDFLFTILEPDNNPQLQLNSQINSDS